MPLTFSLIHEEVHLMIPSQELFQLFFCQQKGAREREKQQNVHHDLVHTDHVLDNTILVDQGDAANTHFTTNHDLE